MERKIRQNKQLSRFLQLRLIDQEEMVGKVSGLVPSQFFHVDHT
jgi:hypothetical protein